jgi:polar amino acid transport system substrate-binding protein
MGPWRTLATIGLLVLAACTNQGGTTSTGVLGTQPSTTAPPTTSGGSTTTEAPRTLPDLEGRTVIAAVDNQTFPFSFEEDGDAQGWDYEALAAICEALNCEVEFQVVASEALTDTVAEGEADVAGDGSLFDQPLAEAVELSEPIIPYEQRLVVRLDETRYNTVGQFSNGESPVGVVEGSIGLELALDTWGSDRVVVYRTLAEAISDLIGGDIDAVVILDFAGQGYVGEGDHQVKRIQGVLASGEVGLIFTPGSDLVEPFNAALTELMVDGTLGTLNAFWFAPATAS